LYKAGGSFANISFFLFSQELRETQEVLIIAALLLANMTTVIFKHFGTPIFMESFA
jgi:hypothetical protein